MKLYVRECKKIATSIIYYLFAVILVFSWSQNFRGMTKTEINWANGIMPANIGFERALLSEPSEDDDYFGSRVSEDDTVAIMTGVTRALLSEYEKNSYAAYPFGYYKAITLSDDEQRHVLEILCEITGLTEEQLEDLPKDYFPAVTGTIISFDAMRIDENGNLNTVMESPADAESEDDKYKHFVSQVTYEHFKELMQEMETIIGEKGSQYSPEMMMTYFGMSEMTYGEAQKEYDQTINQDKVTGWFARLFCDYMGLELGLYPIFLIVAIWMKDRVGNAAELIYGRRISSAKLVITRYLASITMVLLPVFLLSFESLAPLISFGAENGIAVDGFAYIKYILWWLLPEVMAVCATGIFFTLLTDSPIAIVFQFLWWMVDKGVTGLSGDTGLTTLMIRHNTLRGYEIIQDGFQMICMNRLLMAGISILFIILSIWVLGFKRKGKINAPEQSKAIQEVVCTKKIPHWKILLFRFIMSMLLLIMLTGLFSGIMIWKNCTFPFVPYVAGTVISAMALGSLGFAAAILSNSVIAGYLASAGYFLLNSMGNISDDSIFYLFSMGKGNYATKIWLLGLSLLMIAVAFIYERKRKYG